MKKAVLILATTLLLLPVAAGCSGRSREIPLTTDFGKMLGSMPASVLQEHRVWYQNLGLAMEQAGFGNIETYADYEALSADRKVDFAANVIGVIISSLFARQYPDLFGWDFMAMRRSVFVETPLPYQFQISAGTFNATLIKQKFAAQGYAEASHDGVRYLTKGGDYQPDMTSAFTRQVLAAFNRMMVTDDTLITAPTTDIMNGILDARAGKVKSLTSTPTGRALAAAMGEVYNAVIISPGIVPYEVTSQPGPQFDFPAAHDWGTLHDYEMAGIDYRRDGNDRYLDICVAYGSAADARTDAPELARRLNGYVLNTNNGMQQVAFADAYETGEPTVTAYGNVAVVKISCRRITSPEAGRAVSLMIMGQTGDLLFLAPDPTPWLVP